MELDQFDRQLLNLVQRDATQTTERLAEQIHLSPSAVQRRLRRMREQAVIIRDVSIVDPRKAGSPAHFVVGLQLESDRPQLLAQLRTWISVHEEIQQAFYVTGEADFILIITASDVEAYNALMSRLIAENPVVKRFTTNVTLQTIKRGLTVPIRLGAAERFDLRGDVG